MIVRPPERGREGAGAAPDPMVLSDLRPVLAADPFLGPLLSRHPWASKLPTDAEWHSGQLLASMAGGLQHIFAPVWSAWSEGSGWVRDSARSIASSPDFANQFPSDFEILETIAREFDHDQLGSFILGANKLDGGPFMILDGNLALSPSVALFDWAGFSEDSEDSGDSSASVPEPSHRISEQDPRLELRPVALQVEGGSADQRLLRRPNRFADRHVRRAQRVPRKIRGRAAAVRADS